MRATRASASVTSTRQRKQSGKRKLDLACGQSPLDGHDGVDIWEGAKVVHDLTVYPWPFADNECSELHCSHYVEHIPLEVNGTDGLCLFMDECYRILGPGGQLTVRHPHNRSDRAFQDPTHRRFIPAATWHYFNRGWREANRLDHYPIHCDFDVVTMYADGIAQNLQGRPDQAVAWMGEGLWNQFADLVVVLRKNPPKER